MENTHNLIPVGKIISLIKKALEENDLPLLSSMLVQIIETKETNWFTLLCLARIILDPDNEEFIARNRILIYAIELGKERSDNKLLDHARERLESLDCLGEVFLSIKSSLDNLVLWDSSSQEVVTRVASFLEDQNYIMNTRIDEEVEKMGFYEPLTMFLNDKIPTKTGGTSNYISGYEENCENLQLIVAYCLYKYQNKTPERAKEITSPYEDKEFALLLMLASTWRIYKYFWSYVKYKNWQIEELDTKKRIFVFVPSNSHEYFCNKVASVRLQRLKGELGMETGNLAKKIKLSDSLDRIAKISETLSIPQTGCLWNGILNTDEVIKAAKNPHQILITNILLDFFYFSELINEIVIGFDKEKTDWITYHNILIVLRIISQSFITSIKKEIVGFRTEVNREVILIEKRYLIELLVKTTEYDYATCNTVIEVLTFNPKNRHVELWDTPLIPITEEIILFCPSVIIGGSPERSAENFISQWNEPLFKKRGKLLEEKIQEIFENENIPNRRSFILEIENGNQIEFDLVVWWKNYLFLIEAKCCKPIFNGFDDYRASLSIEKAVDQLQSRKNIILEHWDKFRNSNIALDLPVVKIKPEFIHLIAVTNILEFTGITKKGVFITDIFCLTRFFQGKSIDAYLGEEYITTIGKIRNKNKPSPYELCKYLDHPPQTEVIIKDLQVQTVALHKVDENEPDFLYMNLSYEPKSMSASGKEKARKLNKQTKNNRKRH